MSIQKQLDLAVAHFKEASSKPDREDEGSVLAEAFGEMSDARHTIIAEQAVKASECASRGDMEGVLRHECVIGQIVTAGLIAHLDKHYPVSDAEDQSHAETAEEARRDDQMQRANEVMAESTWRESRGF